jgi:VPDSG-CTERM motif
MKINLIPTKKLAILSAALCAAILAFTPNAKASTLNFGDSNDLGFVEFGIPSGDTDRTNYVNHLINMAPGTSNTALGQHFVRSSMNPGPGFGNYPTAVFDHNSNGAQVQVDLGDGTLYSYLFAKYDGPNAGSEVWYVGGMSGIITIPALGIPDHGHQYGLSGWTLFGPGVQQVPDGGTTVMLLGAALGALGMARRFLKS